MEVITEINSMIDKIIWGLPMLIIMVGTGLYFSFRFRFFQILHFRIWWKKTIGGLSRKKNRENIEGISPFEAMSTALAGAIGTGNIVGVAGAIALGGPGAVFWMWLSAIPGMATIYAENYLGVKYRIKRGGRYVGGPMYYISKGLGCKMLALIFALLCTLAAFGMGNITQSNSAAGAISGSFGIDRTICGIVLSLASGAVILGGIKRISALTGRLIPILTVIYIFAAVCVILTHYSQIPYALKSIISSAFDLRSVSGGISGSVMALAVRYGVSRGVFSNEAGLGSSPIANSAADTDDPELQGMWGMFQVFIDTIIMCTLMALCILTSCKNTDKADIMELSISAFSGTFGSAGRYYISCAIAVFAFATLISWCYFGEKSFEYMTDGKFILSYRLLYCLAAFAGSVMEITFVWEISDTINGLMAIPNLIAILALSKKIPGKIVDLNLGKLHVHESGHR